MRKKRITESVKVWVVSGDQHFEPSGRGGEKPIDRHDPKAISVFLQILKYLKPDGMVFLGDALHLGMISHWQTKKNMMGHVPTHDGESTQLYMEDGMNLSNIFLERCLACSPKAEGVVFEGNHEEWLRALRNDPNYRGVRDDLWYPEKVWSLKDKGWKWIPYQRYEFYGAKNYFQIGDLFLLHGQYTNKYFLNTHFEKLQRSFVIGHVHSPSYRFFTNSIDGKEKFGASIGCLCTKEASYHRGRTGSWGLGFAIIYEYKDGTVFYQPVSIHNGVAVLDGKVFTHKPDAVFA